MNIFLFILILLLGVDSGDAAGFEKVIGGADFDRGVYVSETKDGGYITVGVTRSFGAGGYDFYLVKTALDGDIMWSKTYGGDGDDRCWAIAPSNDGGYLLAGETTSSGAGEEDCFLVKVDSSGKEIWSRAYGGAKGDRCFSVVQADDGGYMLAGQTYSEGAGDRDVYIFKTGAEGDFEWSRTFGGSASDVGHYIAGVSDGSYIVTGYTTSFAPEGDDPYLVKIDAEGKSEWTRVLSMAGINHTLTGEQAADGGYYLVGFSVNPESGSRSALLVKTDSSGQFDWHRDILPTKTGESFGYTVRSTKDGGCIFTGHTTVGSAGDRDLLLVKVNKSE